MDGSQQECKVQEILETRPITVAAHVTKENAVYNRNDFALWTLRNTKTLVLEEVYLVFKDTAIPALRETLSRALNCWERAPKDLHHISDLISAGKILREELGFITMTEVSNDFATPEQITWCRMTMAIVGLKAWREHINSNVSHEKWVAKLVEEEPIYKDVLTMPPK